MNNRAWLTLFVATIFLVFTPLAHATTYYVDSVGGLDANNGTSSSTPWQTTTKVNAATFVAGDSILFKRGDTWNGNLVISQSGSSSSPITFDAYGSGASPIINATGNLHALDIRNGKTYVNFNNLTITHGTNEQVFLFNGVTHLTFSNMTLIATGTSIGFNINSGTTTDITITNTTSTVQNSIPLEMSSGSFSNITISNFMATTSLATSSGAGGIYVASNATFSNLSITSTTANAFTQGIAIAGNGTGVTMTNVVASNNLQNGILFSGTDSNITMSNITGFSNASGSGVLFNSSGLNSVSNVFLTSSTFEFNGNDGVLYQFNGTNATNTNILSAFNLNDGFGVNSSWSNVSFVACTADTNGVSGAGADGDGFSFHNSATGSIIDSVAKNNKKSAITHVDGAQVTMINNLFYHTTNGTIALVGVQNTGTYYLYNNIIYSDGQVGTGFSDAGPSSTLENNIISGFVTGFAVTSGTAINDYNIVTNAASSGYAGVSAGAHSLTSNPLFTNAGSRDFTLQYNSPAIDAGVSIPSVTTDILGNPIYGTPDIGPYEYQPPHVMGVSSIDIGAGARIYGDGKFRDLGTVSGSLAHLSILPQSGTFSTYAASSSRPAWLDVTNIANWISSHKTWTESNAASSTMVTNHVVGDLDANKNYTITITGASATSSVAGISGTSCQISSGAEVCTANGSGQLSFSYSGGYSTHTFDIAEIGVPSVSVMSPSDGATVSGVITITATTTVPSGDAIASVQFLLDGIDVGSAVTSSPYQISWNTASSSDGSHVLSAIVTDSYSNMASSTAVSVMVKNMVTVSPPPSLPSSPSVGVASGYGLPYIPGVGIIASSSATSSVQTSGDQSNAALLAELSNLRAQLVALEAQAQMQAAPLFSRDLFFGSRGSDVTQLQIFLISQAKGPAAQTLSRHGTTQFFGKLTQDALAEFQKGAGIMPAVGYFGPITRAYINQL